MTWARRHPVGTGSVARSWYQTAATAAVVATLLLIAGRTSPAITTGGVLAAAAAATAAIEGNRRAGGAGRSVLAVGLLAGCSVGAAVACLIGILTAGQTW